MFALAGRRLIGNVGQMKEVIPAGFFADAVNPTDEEIVRWAYIEGAHYPPEMTQDWDLCVAEPGRRELLVRLASDASCPTRTFFSILPLFDGRRLHPVVGSHLESRRCRELAWHSAFSATCRRRPILCSCERFDRRSDDAGI